MKNRMGGRGEEGVTTELLLKKTNGLGFRV